MVQGRKGRQRGMRCFAEQLATVVGGGSDVAWSLVLFNGWVFAMSWGGVFHAPFSEEDSVFVLHGLWLTSLLACTGVVLVFILLPRRYREIRQAGLVTAAGCLAMSVLAAAGSHGLPAWGIPLFFASGVLSGMGTGILSVYWGKLITRYDANAAMLLVAVSLMGAALITLAIAMVPRPVAYAAMACMPFPLALSFARAVRKGAQPDSGVGRAESHASDAAEGACPKSSRPSSEEREPSGASSVLLVTFLILAVVLGISAGLLRDLTGADVPPLQRALVFGMSTLCASVMLLLSKVPSAGESFSLFYRAIAFIAVAFIVLTVVVQQTAYQSALALGLHTMGFMYFYGLLWVFCVLYAQQAGDAVRVFAAGFFANQAGQIAGVWIGGGLQALLDPGSFMSTASNAMIYLLLFLVIALMARLSTVSSLSDARWGAPALSLASDEGMAVACQEAAERFGLTPREAEILPHLVRGYDRGFIAELLVVSPETVKSHTRHIYEKLGVHTRVELFNAVAACLGE